MFTSFCLLNLNRSFRSDPTLFFSLCSRVSVSWLTIFLLTLLPTIKKRYKNKLRSDPSAQKCLLVKTYPSIKVRSPAGWAVFQTSEAFLTRPAGSGLTQGLLPGRPPKGTTTSVCQYKGAVRTLKPKQPVMSRAVIISGQVWVSPDVLNQTASLPVYLQRFPQIFRLCLLHRRRFGQTQELLKVLFPPSTINRVHVSCSPARPENFLSSWTEVLWRPMKVLPKGSQIRPWTPVAPPIVLPLFRHWYAEVTRQKRPGFMVMITSTADVTAPLFVCF